MPAALPSFRLVNNGNGYLTIVATDLERSVAFLHHELSDQTGVYTVLVVSRDRLHYYSTRMLVHVQCTVYSNRFYFSCYTTVHT